MRSIPTIVTASLLALLVCESKSPAAQGAPPANAPTSPSAPAAPTAPAAPPPSATKPATPQAPAAPPALPAGLVQTAPLPKSKGLGDVMPTARVGERVVFAARVAGRANPFVAGRAMMVVSDPKLLPCNEREDDQCKTPADLCCETPETLRANTATVQVVDARGRMIPVALQGVDGLAVLDRVVIEGVLIERGDKGGFVVNATRVIRAPKVAPGTAKS